ncbi:MFS transporter [Mucilaginibacter hurinus]|uniref:MFS transporter n=1 Tax=Mucilaginibacter hurinus TaxID=2201324 RepID=A0A367GTU8_9SPHI|nr:MFS transporter [Mucilaginibacter hurinus]RCH56133.1 MFS transporter [Mucilaginibacter hurinus]
MDDTTAFTNSASKPVHPIYNAHFALVCLSSLLFSASFNMLIPELPAYLSSLGGAEYKGLIIALFTLTAALSRPFSGKLTDTLGRVPVMAVGSLVCFLCGFLYPVLTAVSGFLFLRLFHGFSTGFKPTATAAYVADIVPQNRWGEAMGIHGICFSTGMALGPAIGSAITNWFSINVLFYTSSVLALLSIAILFNMKKTLMHKQRFSLSMFNISRHDIIDLPVIPAGVVTLLGYMPYGVIVTIIPDWAAYLGVANKGLFFMVFTVASLFIRFIAGRMSDSYGRVQVIRTGLIITAMSLIVMAAYESFSGLMAGAVLFGIGGGIMSPAISAWTIDLASPDQRGKANATMYIALEVGIGLGALLAGWFFNDVIQMIPPLLYASAGILIVGFVYMFYWTKTPYSGH